MNEILFCFVYINGLGWNCLFHRDLKCRTTIRIQVFWANTQNKGDNLDMKGYLDNCKISGMCPLELETLEF